MSRRRRRPPAPRATDSPNAPEPRIYRVYAVAIMLLFVIPVLLPAQENWKANPVDSFPLSYYPMFSFSRGDTKTEYYLLGIGPNGSRHNLPLGYVFPGGMNQGRKQLRKTITLGDDATQQLADAVAHILARRARPEHQQIHTVHVARGRYNLEAYSRGDRRPAAERSLAHSQVPGRTP